MKNLFTGLTTLFILGSSPLYAQRENQNWFFGNNAGLSFAGSTPTALTGSGMVTYEAAASVSDPTGTTLFYTNSERVWNRNHQLMTNGLAIGGQETATQGAVIVRHPGNASQYFLFAVDGCDNQLLGGLKYSLIDMTQQDGLGSVISKANQLSTVPLTEKLTAVRHANGTDTWIVVHGWQTNTFFAYRLSSTGISSPVMTSIGSVHSGGGGALGNANAVGYMKASPNGSKLALAQRDGRFELFDFNNATGQLSNNVALIQNYRSYGVEFSPDGSRLYGTTLDGNSIYQFNLLAGSNSAIVASATVVGGTTNFINYAGALQLGPDGKIYLAIYNSTTLGVINAPNALGSACAYSNAGPSLGGKLSQLGLPNFPNAFASIVAATNSSAVLNQQAELYPNPAQFRTTLVLPASMVRQDIAVTLTNALGGKVVEYSLRASQNDKKTLELPISGLAKGLYTVRISGTMGAVVKQLIVE